MRVAQESCEMEVAQHYPQTRGHHKCTWEMDLSRAVRGEPLKEKHGRLQTPQSSTAGNICAFYAAGQWLKGLVAEEEEDAPVLSSL